MGGTYDPPERNDDQGDDLKAGEEVGLLLLSYKALDACIRCIDLGEIRARHISGIRLRNHILAFSFLKLDIVNGWGCVGKVIRVRYEKGVLKPLDRLEVSEGEVLLIKVLRVELAERVFGSIKIDEKTLEKVMREAEDELGIY
jgi:predicted DNA-binding antitoxin AbrB/MazE fold protein